MSSVLSVLPAPSTVSAAPLDTVLAPCTSAPLCREVVPEITDNVPVTAASALSVVVPPVVRVPMVDCAPVAVNVPLVTVAVPETGVLVKDVVPVLVRSPEIVALVAVNVPATRMGVTAVAVELAFNVSEPVAGMLILPFRLEAVKLVSPAVYRFLSCELDVTLKVVFASVLLSLAVGLVISIFCKATTVPAFVIVKASQVPPSSRVTAAPVMLMELLMVGRFAVRVIVPPATPTVEQSIVSPAVVAFVMQ